MCKMKHLCFSVLGILVPLGLSAQTDKQSKIDSLQNELIHSEEDTTRVNLLCRLSDTYPYLDSVKTFETGEQALRLSKQIGYMKGTAEATIVLGEGYSDYSQMGKAIEYLTEGSRLAKKLIDEDPSAENLKLWADGYYNLGINYAITGDFKKYFECTEEVIPTVEVLKDSLFLANIHTNLGIAHLNLEQYERALHSLQNGSRIYKQLKDPQESTYNRINLAMAFYHLDSLDRMKAVLDQVALHLEKYPNTFDSYSYYNQEGMYYEGKKQYEQAILSLTKALNLAQGDNNSIQRALIYERFGEIYLSLNNYGKALVYYQKYLESSKTRNDRFNTAKALKKIAELKANKKDYSGAYNDIIVSFDIRDSIEELKNVQQLAALELKYDSEKKENEILALQKTNAESALAIEKKKSQTYLWAGFSTFLALIVVGGIYMYLQKLKKLREREHIRETELNALKQEQENKIFSAMLEGQENERKRLAVDLHDGLGGRLSGISLNLSKLNKDRPDQFPEKQLRKFSKDLNDSLSELRSIARNMMPETLLKLGLRDALKDYCNTMSSADTNVLLQFYGSEKGLNTQQRITLYRVIQELINNAIKHAHASEVLVQYVREGNQVEITVEDNGKGFEKGIEAHKGSGMGLSNLKTRVAYLKGNLDFLSDVNEGTTVNVHITIDDAA